MKPEATTLSLDRDVYIEARPETVFPFLTEPSQMLQWFGQSAELEPRPGGMFKVFINDTHTALGRYVEIDAPHRVVFTFGWVGDEVVPPGSSAVEITLTAEGSGTRLRLVHSGLPSDERVKSHTIGWTHYMERIEQAAAGRDPGPDPWRVPPDLR